MKEDRCRHIKGAGRCHRDGSDKLGRLSCAYCTQCHDHAGPRGDAIVDYKDDAAQRVDGGRNVPAMGQNILADNRARWRRFMTC